MSESVDDSLTRFLGDPVEVPLRAKGFSVYPIQLEQIPAVNKLIDTMRPQLQELARQLDQARENGADLSTMFERALEQLDILSLVDEHRDSLTELCSLLTHRPAEDVGRLGIDDFLGLLLALVELNLDFFYLRLRPQLRVNLVRLAEAISSKQRSA
ncbi:hypothetical protein FXN65_10845 [Metapseudomonas lalkuanensis]|uniref:Uncharacterized protein n=1 Tax=Metapseudomonas lalkuanensis TaxID=2604832 RepID=A0A5J6QJB2_9GAMM|nr:hypothetical protein [Pseudomonas lalkuanensis]QEY62547.1 hypothetical protein FXN65_10845 [Pseudomonas lalkuanensis]